MTRICVARHEYRRQNRGGAACGSRALPARVPHRTCFRSCAVGHGPVLPVARRRVRRAAARRKCADGPRLLPRVRCSSMARSPRPTPRCASIRFEFDWDFAGAEKDLARAIELDPSLVAARENYSMFLTSRVRIDEALQQLAAARTVDPLSASVANLTAQAYYFGRRFDDALREARPGDSAGSGGHRRLQRHRPHSDGDGPIPGSHRAIPGCRSGNRRPTTRFFSRRLPRPNSGSDSGTAPSPGFVHSESQVGDPRSRSPLYMLAPRLCATRSRCLLPVVRPGIRAAQRARAMVARRSEGRSPAIRSDDSQRSWNGWDRRRRHSHNMEDAWRRQKDRLARRGLRCRPQLRWQKHR